MHFLEFLLSFNKYYIVCLVETCLTVHCGRDSLYLIGGKLCIIFRYDTLIHREGLLYFVNLVYVL